MPPAQHIRMKMKQTQIWLGLFAVFSPLLLCYAALQVVGGDGGKFSSSGIEYFASTRGLSKSDTVHPIGVIDCTGINECSFVNSLFDTSLQEVRSGMQLDMAGSKVILHSTFDRMYSSYFCGSKAIDFQCSLHASSAAGTICVALQSSELDLALQSYDQVFRRLAKYAFEKQRATSSDGPVEVVIIMGERAGTGEDSTTGAYAEQIETFLRKMWSESYSEVEFETALQVKVVLVRPDNPVLLQQAKNTWDAIQQAREERLRAIKRPGPDAATGAEDVARGLDGNGVTVGELGPLLENLWSKIPAEPAPVLSKSDRESLFLIESAYTACLQAAEVGIQQWQSRIAKGRTVAKFAARVSALAAAVERDYQRGVRGVRGSLARERAQRQRMLQDHVLTAAGRLYGQQLAMIEFGCLNAFRRALAQLIAQDLTPEAQKEQEQLQLRKALFSFRTQAAELEDVALGFVLTEARIAELTTTLETVLREFPESSLAKLEEVRKVERQAKSGKGAAAAASAGGATGRGRRRKGLSKMLGISLGLVGMLRPPGYGNLQGFVGYATSLLGLPLDLLLGVQNDGDAPEIMGEDREYPILRLQPKIKFDIDLQAQ